MCVVSLALRGSIKPYARDSRSDHAFSIPTATGTTYPGLSMVVTNAALGSSEFYFMNGSRNFRIDT